jgi:5'-nucleotidase (lipoprotein e(P4) family)
MNRCAALLLVSLLTPGCRSANHLSTATPSPVASAPASQLPDSIKWVRASAEYVAAFEQTYRLATARVEAAAAGRAASTWAVVLDADETVIDNAQYQEERARAGLPFSDESWDQWVKRREATPLPATATFLTRVHALGGRIAIVTNRFVSQCADTQAVFARYALSFDVMLCRPDGQPSDKNPRFRAVESGAAFGQSTPLAVVAYLGDNILDFPNLTQATRTAGPAAFADFGVRYFILPNPMYGSWQ